MQVRAYLITGRYKKTACSFIHTCAVALRVAHSSARCLCDRSMAHTITRSLFKSMHSCGVLKIGYFTGGVPDTKVSLIIPKQGVLTPCGAEKELI